MPACGRGGRAHRRHAPSSVGKQRAGQPPTLPPLPQNTPPPFHHGPLRQSTHAPPHPHGTGAGRRVRGCARAVGRARAVVARRSPVGRGSTGARAAMGSGGDSSINTCRNQHVVLTFTDRHRRRRSRGTPPRVPAPHGRPAARSVRRRPALHPGHTVHPAGSVCTGERGGGGWAGDCGGRGARTAGDGVCSARVQRSESRQQESHQSWRRRREQRG